MAEFLTQLIVFAVIAGALLVLVVSQTWLRAMINVRLREWLTHDLLDHCLVRKRVYLLSFAGEISVNLDQRIQQDAQHLTELTTTLAIRLRRRRCCSRASRACSGCSPNRSCSISATALLRSRGTWSGARLPIR